MGGARGGGQLSLCPTPAPSPVDLLLESLIFDVAFRLVKVYSKLATAREGNIYIVSEEILKSWKSVTYELALLPGALPPPLPQSLAPPMGLAPLQSRR